LEGTLKQVPLFTIILVGISSSSPSPMDKNEKGHTVYFKSIADPTVIEKEK
jgi:hypothetical protein